MRRGTWQLDKTTGLIEPVSDPRGLAAWRPPLVAAIGTYLIGAAVLGLFAAAIEGWTGFTNFLRTGSLIWLVSLGSSVQLDNYTVGIWPLGITVLLGVLAFLLTAVQVRQRPIEPNFFTPVAGATAGFIAGAVALLVSNDDVAVSVPRAALGAFAVVSTASGLASAHRIEVYWFRLPPRWIPIAEGVSATLLALFGAASLLTIVLLLRNIGDAGNMWAGVAPESQGWLFATLLVLMLPTVIIWTTSVLIGPGFALGVDGHVDLAGTTVEHLPALPVLTVVPAPGPHPGWALALGAIPLLAGFVGGAVMSRYTDREHPLKRWLLEAVITGAMAAAVVSLFVMTATGGFGPGRWSEVGPVWWSTSLLAVAELTAGAVLGALFGHYRWSRGRNA